MTDDATLLDPDKYLETSIGDACRQMAELGAHKHVLTVEQGGKVLAAVILLNGEDAQGYLDAIEAYELLLEARELRQ